MQLFYFINELGKLTTTSTLTIIITDVNDNAPTCESSLYIIQLMENVEIATNVTNIECSDNDIGYSNSAMSYTIALGNTQSTFAVSSTGQVSTASFVDRETYESFQLIIEISDSGTPSFTTTVTVSVIVQGIRKSDFWVRELFLFKLAKSVCKNALFLL